MYIIDVNNKQPTQERFSMFKIFVSFTMPTDGITREREWNGLEKWAAHAVLGRIHRIAKERDYTIHSLTMVHE